MGNLISLFVVFFKIGLFSFGGGYAMISMLKQEATSHNFLSAADFTNIVAISQITPGPIAINMATFVGFKLSGFLGATVATASVALPSFIIVLIVIRFFIKFSDNQVVKNIFMGLRPAVVGLIFAATVLIAWTEFFPNSEYMDFKGITTFSIRSFLIFVGCFLVIKKFKISPIYVMIASAIIGVFIF